MNSHLKPWYAVATPHRDIREGRLEEAVFAANLWAVVQDTAPEVYLDPEELFRCFVGPAARMNLKRLHLGIHFEMEVPEGQALDPNDPALKAMKEAARQLGLTFEVEE